MQAILSLPSLAEFGIRIWTSNFSSCQWHLLKDLRGLTIHCAVDTELEGFAQGIVQAIANSPDLQQLEITNLKNQRQELLHLRDLLPIPDTSPLKIRELCLGGDNLYFDSSAVLYLHSLTSLTWSSNDFFQASEVWQAFRSEGICLSHLKTDMINDDLLEYLSSFQGPRELELETGFSDVDGVAERFFQENLPQMSHTLECLSIHVYIANDWVWFLTTYLIDPLNSI
jgi:hypothetical protein